MKGVNRFLLLGITVTVIVANILMFFADDESRGRMYPAQVDKDLTMPDVWSLMPYLFTKHDQNHTDPLVPSLKVSRNRRNVNVVIAIPSVKRNGTSYLSNTLHSLLDAMSVDERRKVLIVVLLCDLEVETVRTRYETLHEEFGSEITSGLIDVVSPSPSFYPDFDSIKPTLNDKPDRMKWRTKQVLDYVYIMMYSANRGEYFMQLEDDVIVAQNAVTNIIKFVASLNGSRSDWICITFSKLGYIGKLFRNGDLMKISAFYLLFQTAKPVDWLLDEYVAVSVCEHLGNGPASVECQRALNKAVVSYSSPLFQHIGYYSSLDGKKQPLTEAQFEAVPVDPNPPAALTTSLSHFKDYTLTGLYSGTTILWTKPPVYGDYIQVDLIPPIVLSKFLVISGSSTAPSDILEAATFEVKPELAPASLQPNSTLPGFFVLVSFDQRGRVNGSISALFGKIHTVRVNIFKNHTHWAAVRTFQLQQLTAE